MKLLYLVKLSIGKIWARWCKYTNTHQWYQPLSRHHPHIEWSLQSLWCRIDAEVVPPWRRSPWADASRRGALVPPLQKGLQVYGTLQAICTWERRHYRLLRQGTQPQGQVCVKTCAASPTPTIHHMRTISHSFCASVEPHLKQRHLEIMTPWTN